MQRRITGEANTGNAGNTGNTGDAGNKQAKEPAGSGRVRPRQLNETETLRGVFAA